MRRVLAALALALLPSLGWAQINVSGGGSVGASVTGTNDFTGANSFLDNDNFTLKNTSDPTKTAIFNLAAISTGTKRTYALPNVNGTICASSSNCNWNATQTNGAAIDSPLNAQLTFGTATSARIVYASAQTPDTWWFGVPSVSNTINIGEDGDAATDTNNGACGTAACTDPGVVIHDAGATTTQYAHLSAWGLARKSVKTLTESSATAVVQIPVAALSGTSGNLYYTIFAADATDVQNRFGEVQFTVVNKAGTETCVLGTPVESIAVSAGTLTVTIACDTSPTNAVNLTANALSSLTQTTLEARWSVDLIGPGQPARQ